MVDDKKTYKEDYTLARDIRELQHPVRYTLLPFHYTLARDIRELQLEAA